MLVEADAAQEAIERVRAEPQGIVRVSCPSPLLYFQVGEMVVRFLAECPKVEVHLESTSRPVDVIREGFDVAIRARFPPLEESDLVMKVLAESPQRLVATPAVLQGLSRPFVPADLSTLPSLAWGSSHLEHEWSLEGPNGATARIPHRPRFISEDMATLRLAALRDVGVVQLPTIVVRKDVSGESSSMFCPNGLPGQLSFTQYFHRAGDSSPPCVLSSDFLAAEYSVLSRAEAQDRR